MRAGRMPRGTASASSARCGRELQHGVEELAAARSGYDHPVVVAAAVHTDGMAVVAPIPPSCAPTPMPSTSVPGCWPPRWSGRWRSR